MAMAPVISPNLPQDIILCYPSIVVARCSQLSHVVLFNAVRVHHGHPLPGESIETLWVDLI